MRVCCSGFFPIEVYACHRMKVLVAHLVTAQISMNASFFSQSRSLLRGTLVFCLASATSLTACLEVRDNGVAELSDTSTGAGASDEASGPSSGMPDQSSTQEDSEPQPDTSTEEKPGEGTASSKEGSESDESTGSDGSSNTKTNTGATTTSTTGTTTTSTTGNAGDTSSDDSSDETTSTDSTGDTSSDSSSSDTQEPARDCAKISWGQGDVVERGSAKGYVDTDGDDKLETQETQAGMCELHLSGRKCGLVLFGFDG